jgi:N6-adenosine-specific RNA methylase IME4
MTDLHRVMVADPPWAPRDKLPGRGRGAAKHFPVMTTTQLLGYLPALELQGEVRIAGDALLVLWRLASMQTDALDVARAWGFRVVSELVWSKLTAKGKQHFGMGRTVRASHETALICVRGRVSRVIQSHSVRSVFSAPVPCDKNGRPIHSAKPDEVFPIVEELAGGPGLELFARKRREGWAQIGNQLGARA